MTCGSGESVLPQLWDMIGGQQNGRFVPLGVRLVVNWLHNRYLPHAAIYLGKRKEGVLARFGASAFSWIIGIAASVIAALLGVYLKGVLSLP
jgi:hypothetical protein